MTEEELQNFAKKMLNFQGNAKGEERLSFLKIVKEREGEEGLEKLKKKLKDLGVEEDVDNIKSFRWASEGITALTIVTAKEIFGWTEDMVFEAGRLAPKKSFIIKILARHMISLKNLFNSTAIYWEKHFDFGSLEAVEYDEEKRRTVLREKGYKTHPLLCIHHAGYYKGIAEFVIGRNVSVKITASVHKGEDYNEYVVEWEN